MTSKKPMSSKNTPSTVKYNSHFGVYAVIYNDAGDSILLIKKALGCYTGLYDLPGGSMEPHELLEETLYREVNEETGCHITSCQQIGAFSVLYPFTERTGEKITLRHVAAIYTATITGTPSEDGNGDDDSHGCVWVKFGDLNEGNAVPLVLEALKKLKKI